MSKALNRILVVDDDPDIGIMIKIMLEYQGYSVVVTERGEKAEDMVRTGHFDLLIMDMLLSGMNGIDICARLKKDKSVSSIPVIMISAHPNAREISLNAGAEDFVSKPFDMQEMLSKISRFVQPHK
jgi:DNA-binding response OmpR family regulator